MQLDSESDFIRFLRIGGDAYYDKQNTHLSSPLSTFYNFI